MDDIAQAFRATRIDLLDFFADPKEQRSFAARVPYEDYESEFFCWWFDDFHPHSELFSRAFVASEIDTLSTFSAVWERESILFGQSSRPIDELLSTNGWHSVVEAARHALLRLPDGAA